MIASLFSAILRSLCALALPLRQKRCAPRLCRLRSSAQASERVESLESRQLLAGGFDVTAQLAELTSQHAAAEIRQDVIEDVWRTERQLPSSRPRRDVRVSPSVSNVQNLEQMDRLTIMMDSGFSSTIDYFIPRNSSNRLMLVHQGHSDTWSHGVDAAIRSFVAEGYEVLAFKMPTYRGTVTPGVTDHDQFAIRYRPNHNPLKYFMEPIAASLNYLNPDRYETVAMTGISGGGWATTLYAAMDPRVQYSFPVAGSLPLALRSSRDVGDWEQQSGGGIYQRTANYTTLYALGAMGTDRVQVQVLNYADSCCFAGRGNRHLQYEQGVQDRVAELGAGAFDVVIDQNSQHSMSAATVRRIINVVGGKIVVENPVVVTPPAPVPVPSTPLPDPITPTPAPTSPPRLQAPLPVPIVAPTPEPLPDGVTIIDNGDASFELAGTWKTWTRDGYLRDARYVAGGTGAQSAVWEFDVTPGTYEVATTWFAHSNRATNAPFTVYDASAKVLTERLNQRIAPRQFHERSVSWSTIGTVGVNSNTLRVELSNDADGYVIADAIRIFKISEEVQANEQVTNPLPMTPGSTDSADVEVPVEPLPDHESTDLGQKADDPDSVASVPSSPPAPVLEPSRASSLFVSRILGTKYRQSSVEETSRRSRFVEGLTALPEDVDTSPIIISWLFASAESNEESSDFAEPA